MVVAVMVGVVALLTMVVLVVRVVVMVIVVGGAISTFLLQYNPHTSF